MSNINENNHFKIGLAGEYKVIAELLLRGHNLSKTLIDNGADVVLENGKKIQIKSTDTKAILNKNVEFYCFTFHKKTYAKKWKNNNYGKTHTDYFDYLILCVPRDNRFYIIPAKELKNIVSIAISVNPSRQSKYHKYLNKWEELI